VRVGLNRTKPKKEISTAQGPMGCKRAPHAVGLKPAGAWDVAEIYSSCFRHSGSRARGGWARTDRVAVQECSRRRNKQRDAVGSLFCHYYYPFIHKPRDKCGGGDVRGCDSVDVGATVKPPRRSTQHNKNSRVLSTSPRTDKSFAVAEDNQQCISVRVQAHAPRPSHFSDNRPTAVQLVRPSWTASV